ncbi:MAG: hypothetical protein ABI039_05125, partial [Vicinamibacterales bacterium]
SSSAQWNAQHALGRTMHMEHRKSFQRSVGLGAFALATALYLSMYQLLPSSSVVGSVALLLLYAGAIVGFERLLVLLLPPIVAKLWPSLDSERT